MNMREMDIIGRIELGSELGSALRHAHIIDALVGARYVADDPKSINDITTRHENGLADSLAKIADMLGLALVDKAVVAKGAVNIVFDGPPGPDPGRFVEVETDGGRSINAGEWIERTDGLWALRITELHREVQP